MRRPLTGPRRVLLAVVCLLSLSACASLPDSSAPQALGSLDHQPTSTAPNPPIAGREPEQLLLDFMAATADPTSRHQAARQFLSPAANTAWDDAAATTIVDSQPNTLRDSRSGDSATYVIRARKIGELAMDGSYRAAEGTLETKGDMEKIDGEWRIKDLPNGVIVEQAAFAKSYHRYSLFFPNLAGVAMVPDLRWISVRKDQLAHRLLSMLGEGTQAAPGPATHNPMAAPVALRGPITKANGDPENVGVGGGGVAVDFSGVSPDPAVRDLMAAQVVLTLSGADVAGPYVLNADGKPLNEKFANGWQRSDVEGRSPAVIARNRVGLHAVRDGLLVAVVDSAITPAPGYFGTTHTLQSVGLSPDGQLVAAVAKSGRPDPEPERTLVIGTYDGQGFPVATGGTFTRPSWPADGSSAWSVVDGDRVIRAVLDRTTGNVSVQDVDITELVAAAANSTSPRTPITELRISPSGARAALIANGKVYVAVVVPQPNGKFSLTSPLPLAIGLSTPAVSLDWFTDEKVIVGRDGNVDPVAGVLVDGSEFRAQTSQNLTPPVRVVSAAPDSEYVADSRTVLELTRNPEGREDYWREVPGLGANAVPVLPG
ncbi:MtrAB system accessory protein LpqB [Nocardia seriolae]|uniref:MtrAB system accessory lipoprotein LpqB n=1 Tax=Nocardia seriolae TaxID=37332 RepID=UPI0012BC5857|nr:MtrAB system accessory lipoprotein LpqB [Nocardia seriolae]MTJ65769.1 MtrAB system accessory protein LpqB [Nocardia seriolae]MTJ75124.1 MtrAB system accessory protein LpqB [Nocardia seriolae]MTJ86298.1 MtrAB system accessory protein LpqB [Nocardia seriolae]MTK30294.1 MtrAB system accessory protein LpqB [Nocardia seriolae]MTK43767.1 MtrAB system accessory protein LpqB [Nocardia seriolae]